MWNCTHFGHPTDEQLRRVDIYIFLATKMICSLSTLNTFSDASENAYTAVVYACHVNEGGNITARLIMSKSRLAPLKAVSIPRLELLGALVGFQLTRQVCSALEIPTNGVTYWVDNMNVGY